MKGLIKDSEEDKALQSKPLEPNKSSDYSLIEMTIPEWFCPIICAGLDLEELIPNKPLNNQHVILKENKKKKEKENKY